MISKSEKQQLKALLQDSKWQTLENLAKELCDEIKERTIVGDTEWETLQNALLNEGQIRGIKNLLQEAYRQAQNV